MFERVEDGETRELEDACCLFSEDREGIFRKAFLKESDLYDMFDSADSGRTRVLEGGPQLKDCLRPRSPLLGAWCSALPSTAREAALEPMGSYCRGSEPRTEVSMS